MAQSIFFSWQADTPDEVGRSFVRSVLKAICKEIAADTSLDEAVRNIKFDSDTQGVAGQPPIADTILKKIDGAALVVSDMTFTGKRLDGRPTPNPNVLIEYGWALRALSYNRVISVMNVAYGAPGAETLPFDLAHLRWPMQYNLPDGAEPAVVEKEKEKLKGKLKAAVRASLAMLPSPVVVAPPEFVEAVAKDGSARFRAPGEALGIDDDVLSGPNRDVFLAPGPAAWLRLMPVTAQQTRRSAKELLQAGLENSALFPLRKPAGGYSYVRASDGQGIYRAVATPDATAKPKITNSVAFAFRSGEVWSVDTGLLSFDEKNLYAAEIESVFADAADRYRKFLRRLGIEGPYRWIAGLEGVRARRLAYPPRPGYDWVGDQAICATDHIQSQGALNNEQNTADALLPFFKSIFDECGIDRPDYLSKS